MKINKRKLTPLRNDLRKQVRMVCAPSAGMRTYSLEEWERIMQQPDFPWDKNWEDNAKAKTK